jgi:hypothetical protein
MPTGGNDLLRGQFRSVAGEAMAVDARDRDVDEVDACLPGRLHHIAAALDLGGARPAERRGGGVDDDLGPGQGAVQTLTAPDRGSGPHPAPARSRS